MGRLRYKHVTPALIRREYGSPSNTWLGLQIFGCVLSGPERSWRQVLHIKENSLIEVAEDMLWITNPSAPAPERGCSVMQRIGMDGKRLRLYRAPLQPRLKEHLIYDLPSTAYDGTLPDNEYRHMMLMLRKGNLLTRHDLCTGIIYDTMQLGSNFSCNTLMWSPTQDLLAIKSVKVKVQDQMECCFQYQIFNLHPFKKITSFIIHGMHFPGVEDKKKYGKLRDTEIHEGLLLIITDKSHVLLYDADEVIARSRNNNSTPSYNWPPSASNISAAVTAPPLLFATWVHQDILSIGARHYIRSVSDFKLEVRELGSRELITNGSVTWGDYNDITPDYLLFHPDDSNRVIHTRTRDIRVLAIKRDGDCQQYLKEEFRYSNYKDDKTTKQISQFSRSGRLLKTTFFWDDSFNEAVTYDVDRDMDIFAVLEAHRDTEHNCSIIKKVTMFNSHTYEVTNQVIINMRVDGDIETNRTSLFLARDTMSIVIRGSSGHTLLMYRLVENFKKGKKKENTRSNRVRQDVHDGQTFIDNKYMKRSRKTRTMESDDENYTETRPVQRHRRQHESDDGDYTEEVTQRNRRAGKRLKESEVWLKYRESDEECEEDWLKKEGRSQLGRIEKGESSKESGLQRSRRKYKKTKKYSKNPDEDDSDNLDYSPKSNNKGNKVKSSKDNIMESRRRTNRSRIVDSDTEYSKRTNTGSQIKCNESNGKNKDTDREIIENNSTPSTSVDNKLISIRGWKEDDSDDDEDDYEEDGNEDEDNEEDENNENNLSEKKIEEKIKKKVRKVESDEDYIPQSLSKEINHEESNKLLIRNLNNDTNRKRKMKTKSKRKENDYDYVPSTSSQTAKQSDEDELDDLDNTPKSKTKITKVKINKWHVDNEEPSTSNMRTRKLEIRCWGNEKYSSEENSSDTRYESDSDFEEDGVEKKISKRSMKRRKRLESDSDLEEDDDEKKSSKRTMKRRKQESDPDFEEDELEKKRPKRNMKRRKEKK